MPFQPHKVHSNYHASFHGGTRPTSAIRYIEVHAAEALSAAGIAAYFAGSGPGGSTHLTIDNDSTYRCLSDEVIAYSAPPLNEESLSFELAAYTSWKRPTWLAHRAMLEEAAYWTARWAKKYGIPLKWRSSRALRAGKPGICGHLASSHAFGRTDHTDPGRPFPRRRFSRLARFAFMHYLRKHA